MTRFANFASILSVQSFQNIIRYVSIDQFTIYEVNVGYPNSCPLSSHADELIFCTKYEFYIIYFCCHWTCSGNIFFYSFGLKFGQDSRVTSSNSIPFRKKEEIMFLLDFVSQKWMDHSELTTADRKKNPKLNEIWRGRK